MYRILFYALVVSLSLTIVSCGDDPMNPCDNTTCENGGVCVSGDCDCPEGFSGSTCETVNVPLVEIGSIILYKWPELRPDGSFWDEEVANSNNKHFPDVIPSFSQGAVATSDEHLHNDAVNAFFGETQYLVHPRFDLNQNEVHTIGLWDVDDSFPLDLPSMSVDRPDPILVYDENDELVMEISVEWE